MEIKMQTRELSKVELYRATKGRTTSVRELVGAEIHVDFAVLYTDVNAKGEAVEVLVFADENGNCYSTISDTFKRTFNDILDIFAIEEMPPLKIEKGLSKSGREYMYCDI